MGKPQKTRVKVDRRIYKKCIKCRQWYPRKDLMGEVTVGTETIVQVIEKHGFGKHKDAGDGLQVICFLCKNIMNNKARNRNVRARVRHHTGTRCLTQLGKPLTPKNFVADLEDYLGYRISALVKHLSVDLKKREGPKRRLRDAFNEGYHIDHIRPLSLYAVVVMGDADSCGYPYVDWDVFKECWAISNLMAIPATENLQKGAKYERTEPV